MSEVSNLTNQLLIAMPGMGDPHFERTVSYICEHNEGGAVGIIINRPLKLCLQDMLSQMGLECADKTLANMPIFAGGPVQKERGFVIHHDEAQGQHKSSVTQQNSNDISVTTSRDILEAIAADASPQKVLVSLGYAGWGPGQLEKELMENCWLSGPSNDDILFNLPAHQRWNAAAKLLGVDLALISAEVGHA